MSTNVGRTPADSGAFRAHEEIGPDLRFEGVDAFSCERMLELLVHLMPDGYSITLFDWLDRVPRPLHDVAIRAFRATEMPRVSGVCETELTDYVDRLRGEIRRRLEY